MINIPEIKRAVSILRQEGLVAFPTETVYGLGADASSESAVLKVFAAKGRPHANPLIVHLANISQLTDWANNIPEAVYQLAQAFWPGPLTIVLPKKSHVLDIVTGNQETVALRVPNHPVALALLEGFGGGIVAPSANQFTHVSPTTAEAVREELGNKVDMILEGGACTVGLESTILDMSQTTPCILRPGMITKVEIEKVLGVPVLTAIQTETRVPGQYKVHYAPTTKTLVLPTEKLQAYLQHSSQRLAVLAYSTHLDVAQHHLLKMSDDPIQYAHDLYHSLRILDHLQLSEMVVEAVPSGSAWEAIRDRLLKASGEIE